MVLTKPRVQFLQRGFDRFTLSAGRLGDNAIRHLPCRQGGSFIMAQSGQKHVLDGYKALDFTQFVAGPTVTKLMAEMGAEVIKVELAPDGDRSRSMPFVRNERSGYFVQQNRGKLSLCL